MSTAWGYITAAFFLLDVVLWVGAMFLLESASNLLDDAEDMLDEARDLAGGAL